MQTAAHIGKYSSYEAFKRIRNQPRLVANLPAMPLLQVITASEQLFFDPNDGDWKPQSAVAGCRLGRFCEERHGFSTLRVDQEQRRGSISYDHQPGGGFDQHFGVQRKRLAYMRASLSLPVRWIEIKQLTTGTRSELFYLNPTNWRSEEHTSELQSHSDLVCRLLLEKKKTM